MKDLIKREVLTIKKKFFLFFSFILLLITGCNDKEVTAIYEHLEKTVQLEASFATHQVSLQEAEQKESELYEQIIALHVDEHEKVSALVEEALQLVEERVQIIAQEKESMEASAAEFAYVDEYVEEVDGQLRPLLHEVIATMEKRYEQYERLYNEYVDMIDHERILYETLKVQDVSIEEIQTKIDVVNESYERVHNEIEQFNQITDEYNDKKKKFYEATSLNVSYK